MVTQGGGTPLPTATAPRLVVAGPYRFVRNPLALAGILQGIAVGWLLGSVPVIVYSLTGIFAWHVFVRPAEEQDLLDRFGTRYQRLPESRSSLGSINQVGGASRTRRSRIACCQNQRGKCQ
ncbi:methyltransferase family protein [Rhodopirellula sp. JC639]|uniref:methyltransferase family protein n=1 Tax=Stieleria mannarensis TaxID=2755585 RepID=UPI002570E2E7|nr:methyltransferase [Rhodopirellula sp. JC639]